eukprot:6887282-Prymnesium_polylepis.1
MLGWKLHVSERKRAHSRTAPVWRRPTAEHCKSVATSRRICQTRTRSIEWVSALQPRTIRAGLEARMGTQG